MMYLLFCCFMTFADESFEGHDDLAAHITTDAKTGEVGQISLSRSPGTNLNSNLLLSSLSVVIFDRVSLGTIPILYFAENHRLNLTLKYTFWEGEEWSWALASQYALYRARGNLTDPPYDPYYIEINAYSLQLVLNYLPRGSRWAFGYSINHIFTDAAIASNTVSDSEHKHIAEPGADVSYAWNSSIDTTIGFGWLRNDGISAYESTAFGFGTSLRWKRPGAFLSAPQIGIHYTPKTDNVLYLLNTKIY
jgi:hypothetical protein